MTPDLDDLIAMAQVSLDDKIPTDEDYPIPLSPEIVIALVRVAMAAKNHIDILDRWGASPLDNAARFGDDFIPPTDEEFRLEHVALIEALKGITK